LKILTFDIGGANTKKLVMDGGKIQSSIHYFPIWKKKDELSNFLQELGEEADAVGITLTAELSDVFDSRREGVEYVVGVCEEVFDEPFYLSVDRRLLRHREVDDPLELAAANWVASLAFLENRYHEGIMLDIGSTTTDILPFRKGEILSGKTDLERLEKGQLLYMGVLRTPVNTIVNRLPYKGKFIPISSEYFAITADVYNVLDMLNDYSCETPDGKGKGKKESLRRLARLLCSDPAELGEESLIGICEYVHQKQVEIIAEGLREISVNYGLGRVYVCGIGIKLAVEASTAAGLDYVDLSSTIETYANLPCFGLAEMLREYLGG
jgi:hypothetical protein